MRTTSKLVAGALAATFAFPAGGCATIFHGTKQEMNVESESNRATLRADGAVIEPGKMDLRRGESHKFTAEEPGKKVATTKVKSRISWGYAILDTVVAVVFFPIGLAAPIVDLVDGAMFNLEPEYVSIPAPKEPAPPPQATPAPAPSTTPTHHDGAEPY